MRNLSTLVAVVALAGSTLAGADATALPRNEAGFVSFTGVVKAPGLTSAQIYSNAMFFVARAYKSSTHVIKLDDKESGRLIVKGTIQEPSGLISMGFDFTLTIEVKDERYRWTIDQILQKIPDSDGTFPIEMRLNKDGVGTLGFKASIERLRVDLVSIGRELADSILKQTKAKDDF